VSNTPGFKVIMPGRVWLVASTLIVTCGLAADGRAPDRADVDLRSEQPTALLTTTFGFTAEEIKSASRGVVVTKSLEPGDSLELAVAALMRIQVPATYFVTRMRHTRDFKQSDAIIDLGVFGNPPALSDLARLTLEPSDLADLARCRVARCDVKLDAGALTRFSKEINWRAPDAHATANALARKVLFEYLTAYQRRGLAGLPEYRDRDQPVNLGNTTRTLLARNTWIAQRHPDLYAYLDKFPAAPAAAAQDIFYWSKEKFGLKPVVALTHMTIWAAGNDGEILATSRQLYGSHYSNGSLGVTLVVPDRSGPAGGVFVVYVNRSIADAMGGWLGGLKRSVARSRARSTVADQLRQLRVRLEAEYKPVPW
jgi:hypothetical protein